MSTFTEKQGRTIPLVADCNDLVTADELDRAARLPAERASA
jgi:hypothetical protein